MRLHEYVHASDAKIDVLELQDTVCFVGAHEQHVLFTRWV